MSIKIAIHSNKGGVYKTSTDVSLAVDLAERNFKTLIIDCDAQNNVQMNFKNVENDSYNLFNVVTEKVCENIYKYIKNVHENIDIITNSFDYLNIDYNIYTNTQKYKNPLNLFQFVDYLEHSYDFILFDLSSAYSLYNLETLRT